MVEWEDDGEEDKQEYTWERSVKVDRQRWKYETPGTGTSNFAEGCETNGRVGSESRLSRVNPKPSWGGRGYVDGRSGRVRPTGTPEGHREGWDDY